MTQGPPLPGAKGQAAGPPWAGVLGPDASPEQESSYSLPGQAPGRPDLPPSLLWILSRAPTARSPSGDLSRLFL